MKGECSSQCLLGVLLSQGLSLYYVYCQIVVRPAVLAPLSNKRTAYCDQIEFVD